MSMIPLAPDAHSLGINCPFETSAFPSLLRDLNLNVGQAGPCICLNAHMNYILNACVLNLHYCKMSVKLGLEFD